MPSPAPRSPAIPRASAARRVFKGYGPLVVFALLFALMAAFVPTVDREESVSAGGTGTTATIPDFSAGDQNGATETTDTTDTGATPSAPAAGGTVTSTQGGTKPGAPATTGSGTKGAGQPTAAGVLKCSDRDKQIPGDPYSPPCLVFKGDNGGATAKGVTDKEIVVSARILDEKGFQQTLAALAGAEITDKPEDVKRTISRAG